ncbi:secretion pathway protein Sls2/Rcy1 [Polychaeton citri CBS 116435]|uniref:Secretion pathway protein Sls2/Rcy1 n=1 Tax=Polychaeton citri CBS 116435 TaxID=1314669 RepID=A0A9P4QIH3_9PEZI|nr:secretion pathway protein Sls2/Rcy1 [Polychaeton citri CBS 116435]
MSGRNTPRSSRNLSHIHNISLLDDTRPRSSNVSLSALRSTQLVNSKPLLPAELLATILDYLPVSDLMSFARVSRRLNEMVYDDTRWVQKLRAVGAWNDVEARQRFENGMKKKVEAQRQRDARHGVGVNGTSGGGAEAGRARGASITLFDAGVEEDRYRKSLDRLQQPPGRRKGTLTDGFDELTISSPTAGTAAAHKPWDPKSALNIFDRVRSVRGYARQEFGKLYGALAPLYLDLAKSKGHSDPMIFRSYRDPEQQAQVLANLKRFSQYDSTLGWHQRVEKVESLMGVFSNAVLQEFEQGYTAQDTDGRMKRYAGVLVTLNGGTEAIDAFISNHPVMSKTQRLGNPMDCLDSVAPGHVDLNPSQSFFESLAGLLVEQAGIIDRVFPPTVDVLTPFLVRLCEDIVSDYLTTLFDEAHNANQETYVKAVSGTFSQALRLVASLKATKASPTDFRTHARIDVCQCFERHVDLYLAEELSVFKAKCDYEVSYWEKQMSDQEASTESFFMSNVNRQAAKRDFLSSFRKVVMMPVNVLPFGSRPAASAKVPSSTGADTPENIDDTRSPIPGSTPMRSITPQPELPTTELAAKKAIMNSRLEGIKSLFSLEVALNLTHNAKSSIERAAPFVQMEQPYGQAAREQCGTIFVCLVDILGNRHIRGGFDKAVKHLGDYNPREVREFRAQHTQGASGSAALSASIAGDGGKAVGVEPLVTFLELVNVGDLIQQMVDVFYAQELVSPKLTDRDDFLDPVQKEKKKFEQMLDDRVAAGLNKGIDVLMDEVEYLCATTQLTSDFNPTANSADPSKGGSGSGLMDIGPSETAQKIVDTVSGHTNMLVGSTDKNMLDVFTQEVGLRLFGVLCKHFKRQRISVDGAIKLISDINHYSSFINTLRQKPLMPYFSALRELGQIYLVHIDPPANLFAGGAKRASGILSGKSSTTAAQAKELAAIIADTQRYRGIFPAEEVYEFAERRADWYVVKRDVERAMYGIGCTLM